MKRRLFIFRAMYLVLLAVMVIMCAYVAIIRRESLFVFVLMTVFAVLVTVVALLTTRAEVKRYLTSMGKRVDASLKEATSAIPMAAVVIDQDGAIVWYNKFFRERILRGRDSFGEKLGSRISGIDFEKAFSAKGQSILLGDRRYTVFGVRTTKQSGDLICLYMVDDTELKLVKQEYMESRPSIMLIMLDNYEEFMQNLKESEKAQIAAQIEALLESYITKSGGHIIKTSRDKFTAIVEERCLREMTEQRFSVLDSARLIVTSENMPATLSIGVGRGFSTLRDSERGARQALDMALGRGGDQAAIKSQMDLSFYGGVSKAVEKRTKVKTRIVATALSELIQTSDEIMIMGHRFPDLDCIGAAVGLYRSISLMGKPCHIALDRSTNLADLLVTRMESSGGYQGVFVDPQMLVERVTKKTLLIIVDTHVPNFVENTALYEAVKTVVVIDHHRKMVGHIENAMIFYHEPYASSTAEMVTELIQYFETGKQIGSLEAEALLAGIMLDTKNFVLKTGVRTFEAAAYLRKLGADTVQVKKLFASSMETYQMKTHLVAEAKLYRHCAIGFAAEGAGSPEALRLAVPQAADELLSINDVDASFVYYRLPNGQISYSARSLGIFNVQLVMEALGGGGHHTMAGAQIEAHSLEEAEVRLCRAIDEYYSRQTQQK